MIVRVRYFASLRERAGKAESSEEVALRTTVGGLWEAIRGRPEFTDLGMSPGFAVNGEWCDGGRVLVDGDEVGLLPPVSGG